MASTPAPPDPPEGLDELMDTVDALLLSTRSGTLDCAFGNAGIAGVFEAAAATTSASTATTPFDPKRRAQLLGLAVRCLRLSGTQLLRDVRAHNKARPPSPRHGRRGAASSGAGAAADTSPADPSAGSTALRFEELRHAARLAQGVREGPAVDPHLAAGLLAAAAHAAPPKHRGRAQQQDTTAPHRRWATLAHLPQAYLEAAFHSPDGVPEEGEDAGVGLGGGGGGGGDPPSEAAVVVSAEWREVEVFDPAPLALRHLLGVAAPGQGGGSQQEGTPPPRDAAEGGPSSSSSSCPSPCGSAASPCDADSRDTACPFPHAGGGDTTTTAPHSPPQPATAEALPAGSCGIEGLYREAGGVFARFARLAAAAAPPPTPPPPPLPPTPPRVDTPDGNSNTAAATDAIREGIRRRRVLGELTRAQGGEGGGARGATATTDTPAAAAAAAVPRHHHNSFPALSVLHPVLPEQRRAPPRKCRVRLRGDPTQNCTAAATAAPLGRASLVGGDTLAPRHGLRATPQIRLLPEMPHEQLRLLLEERGGGGGVPYGFSSLLSYAPCAAGYGRLAAPAGFRDAVLRQDSASLVDGRFAEPPPPQCAPAAACEEGAAWDVPEAEGMRGGEREPLLLSAEEEVGGGGGGVPAVRVAGQKRKLVDLLHRQLAASVSRIVAGQRRFNISKVGVILTDLFARGDSEAHLCDVYDKAKEDTSLVVTPQVIFAAVVQHVHHNNVNGSNRPMAIRATGDEVVVTRDG